MNKTRNNNGLFSLIIKEKKGQFKIIKQKTIEQRVTIGTTVTIATPYLHIYNFIDKSHRTSKIIYS